MYTRDCRGGGRACMRLSYELPCVCPSIYALDSSSSNPTTGEGELYPPIPLVLFRQITLLHFFIFFKYTG